VGKGFKRGVLFGRLDLRSQPRRCIACRRLVSGVATAATIAATSCASIAAASRGDPDPAPPLPRLRPVGPGRTRCIDCQASRGRTKRKRRPDLDDRAERERRRRLVADHRAQVGDCCPGLGEHPPTPVPTWSPITSSKSPPEDPPAVPSGCCAGRRSAWLATGLVWTHG
jgi:hypothetical protein